MDRANHPYHFTIGYTSDLAECGGRGLGEREEQPVSVHALSGAASFAACMRLFWSYPLAIGRCRTGGSSRMVLRHGDANGCYVLNRDEAGHFSLRPWGVPDAGAHRIRPVEPVLAAVHEVITQAMPVPRDGALLGWVPDRQVTVLLSVYHGAARGPQVRVLPMAGTQPLDWPAFTTSPLHDGRLWQYVDRGQLVDLTPLTTRNPGRAYWVPSQNRCRADAAHGCVVVRQNLAAEEYWLPEGVYLDHWMLREGVPTPPPAHLLTLPGTTDLARWLILS